MFDPAATRNTAGPARPALTAGQGIGSSSPNAKTKGLYGRRKDDISVGEMEKKDWDLSHVRFSNDVERLELRGGAPQSSEALPKPKFFRPRKER